MTLLYGMPLRQNHFAQQIPLRGHANLWITEKLVTYDGRPVNTVTIMEFRDGKVSHETHYFADPFEPPEWRSQWVQRLQLPENEQKE